MIKAILFDLDGVLLDARDWHFLALNEALKRHGLPEISKEDHETKFNGLSTRQKLTRLGCNEEKQKIINADKQQITLELIEKLAKPYDPHVRLMKNLKKRGYKLACCSNAVLRTVVAGLEKVGLGREFQVLLSNEQVKNPKPDPEIYLLAAKILHVKPQECLVVEDNENGIAAARNAGCNVFKVNGLEDVTQVTDVLEIMAEPVNVVIPMAGNGQRFRDKGYKDPKPFISVDGIPMIEKVLNNLHFDGVRFILLARKEHITERADSFKDLFNRFPNMTVIPVDKLTEGAACTVLLARELIDNDQRLIIANSDQIVDFSAEQFVKTADQLLLGGSIVTFKDTNPKWSFAKVDEMGYVTETKEKDPISDNATAGIYYFRRGRSFVKAATDMIACNDRSKNEFYVCPAFNYLDRELNIGIYPVDKTAMHGLGTPEDLELYLSR